MEFRGDVIVQIITDEGAQMLEEHRYKNLKEGVFTYDLSSCAALLSESIHQW